MYTSGVTTVSGSDADLRRRYDAQKQAESTRANPPTIDPAVAALNVDERLRAMTSEALRVSRETQADGAEVDASTLLQQAIAKSQLEFSEGDLIKVATFLGADDVPTWFDELASWL